MKKLLKRIFSDKNLQVKIILISGIILVIFAPYLLTLKWGWREFDSQTGVVGDTIGGITAPIVNLISAILVYYAFTAQIEANKIINKQFLKGEENQIISYNRDYIFKLYELLTSELSSIKYTASGSRDYKGFEAVSLILEAAFGKRVAPSSFHETDLVNFHSKMDLFNIFLSELEKINIPPSDRNFLCISISQIYNTFFKKTLSKLVSDYEANSTSEPNSPILVFAIFSVLKEEIENKLSVIAIKVALEKGN